LLRRSGSVALKSTESSAPAVALQRRFHLIGRSFLARTVSAERRLSDINILGVSANRSSGGASIVGFSSSFQLSS